MLWLAAQVSLVLPTTFCVRHWRNYLQKFPRAWLNMTCKSLSRHSVLSLKCGSSKANWNPCTEQVTNVIFTVMDGIKIHKKMDCHFSKIVRQKRWYCRLSCRLSACEMVLIFTFPYKNWIFWILNYCCQYLKVMQESW